MLAKFVRQSSPLRNQQSNSHRFRKAFLDKSGLICTTIRQLLTKECIENQMKISSPFIWKRITNGFQSMMATAGLPVHSFWNSTFMSVSSPLTGEKIFLTLSEKPSSMLSNSGKKKVITQEVAHWLYLFMTILVMLLTWVTLEPS